MKKSTNMTKSTNRKKKIAKEDSRVGKCVSLEASGKPRNFIIEH
jgi:hypothetical protein